MYFVANENPDQPVNDYSVFAISEEQTLPTKSGGTAKVLVIVDHVSKAGLTTQIDQIEQQKAQYLAQLQKQTDVLNEKLVAITPAPIV